MEKKALEDNQFLDLEDVVPMTLEVDENPSDALQDFFDNVVEEVEEWTEDNEGKDNPEPKEIFFKLDLVPGASEDEFVEEKEVVEVEENVEQELVDPWDWTKQGGTSTFLDWIKNMFQNVPKHTGKDTTGVERAISYFERLDKEISMAMRKDFNREIDAAKAEQARDEIEKGLNNLMGRLEKLNTKKFKKRKGKKAFDENSLVKEGGSSVPNKTMISVPYFISGIARLCIEATVQAGKDIEECYNKMASDFNLDKREKFQVATLIKDMGYPLLLDRANFGEDDLLPSESKVSEYMTQYYA